MCPRRIEICGGVASGKTTLATICSELPALPCYEEFHKNPFYDLFYDHPGRYDFEAEVTFLLQHMGAAKGNADTQDLTVCDFSFALDLAFATTNLRGSQMSTFDAVILECLSAISLPTLIIHLIAEPSEQIARIRQRGRAVEQTIETEYLAALNQNVELALASQVFNKIPTLRLMSSRIDLSDPRPTLDMIRAYVGRYCLKS